MADHLLLLAIMIALATAGAVTLVIVAVRVLRRRDAPAHGREPAKAQRAPRGHRHRAAKHRRSGVADDLAAERARQQAAARGFRPSAHGAHRPGRAAEKLL